MTICPNSGSYWVESYNVVRQGWPNIVPSAGRKYDLRTSQGASENSLFPPKKIDLTESIYGRLKPKPSYVRRVLQHSFHLINFPFSLSSAQKWL